jgi:hypothetical protein
MKKLKILFTAFCMMVVLGACEFLGLELQEDYEFKPGLLDPHIDMSAYEFMVSNPGGQLTLMNQAVVYAGLEEEYKKPGRTFFLLHDMAVTRLNSQGQVDVNSYFGKNTVNDMPATKWEDYPVEQVRDLLLYHIAEGEYSFHNLTPDNVTTDTMLGGENGIMLLHVRNDRDSKLRINDFFGSAKVVQARTTNILSTNGPIHIVGDYALYGQN